MQLIGTQRCRHPCSCSSGSEKTRSTPASNAFFLAPLLQRYHPHHPQWKSASARASSGSGGSDGAAADGAVERSSSKHARRPQRLKPEPEPIDPLISTAAATPHAPHEHSDGDLQGSGHATRSPLSAYEPLPPGFESAVGEEAVPYAAPEPEASVSAPPSPTTANRSGDGGRAAAAATAAAAPLPASGAFFSSRGRSLLKLQRRQQALLAAAARPSRHAGSRSTSSSFLAMPQPSVAADRSAGVAAAVDGVGLASELGRGQDTAPSNSSSSSSGGIYRYTVTPDGRIVPVRWQKDQQRRRQKRDRSGPTASSLADDIRMLLRIAEEGTGGKLPGGSQAPAVAPDIPAAAAAGAGAAAAAAARELDGVDDEVAQLITRAREGRAAAAPPAQQQQGEQQQQQRPPVALRVFTYCVPQTDLRRALWAAGLPASCMEFVATVQEADVVLHLRPAPGERQFAYDEVRSRCGCCGFAVLPFRCWLHTWGGWGTLVDPESSPQLSPSHHHPKNAATYADHNHRSCGPRRAPPASRSSRSAACTRKTSSTAWPRPRSCCHRGCCRGSGAGVEAGAWAGEGPGVGCGCLGSAEGEGVALTDSLPGLDLTDRLTCNNSE